MNRLIKLLGGVAALIIATTSCSSVTESNDGGTEDLSLVTVDVTVPLTTQQSISSGYSTKSLTGYDLRVIVEMYNADGGSVAAAREVLYTSESELTNTSSVVASLKVAAGSYDVLVWCDYIGAADADTGERRELAYNVSSLLGVVANVDTYGSVECNSLRRAFAGAGSLDFSDKAGALKATAEVSVPVVSVVGGYLLTDTSAGSSDGYKALVTYSDRVSTGFNVKTGRVNAESANMQFYSAMTVVNGVTVVAYDYLLMDDSTRAESSKSVNVSVAIYDGSGSRTQVLEKSVTVTSEQTSEGSAPTETGGSFVDGGVDAGLNFDTDFDGEYNVNVE